MLELLCGSLVGITHLVLGQPFDYIKVKFQTIPASSFEKNSHSFNSFCKEIRNQNGLFGFYKGSSILTLGFPLVTAVQFSLYETIKLKLMKGAGYKFQYGQTPQQVLKLNHIGIAGMLTGIACSFLYCPIEYAKIQAQTAYKSEKVSSVKILVNEIKKNSMKNIYNGIKPTFFREAVGGYAYFYIYEATVRKICEMKNTNRKFAQFQDFVVGGAAAGFSFWTIAYPWDCMKTRAQANMNNLTWSQKAIKSIVNKGYGVSVVRGAIINAISFSLYEQVKVISQLFMLIAVA